MAATVGPVRGRDAVATLDDGGTVPVWDLAIGEQVTDPVRTSHTGSAAHLELGDLHGTPVMLTGSSGNRETTIAVWNLDTGDRIGSTFHSRGDLSSLKVGEVDGDPVIVAGDSDELHYDDKLIWVWDLASGEQLTEPFGDLARWPWQQHYGISDLTLAELDGTPVAVSGGYDTMIRVWDLRTGDLLVGHRLRPWDR